MGLGLNELTVDNKAAERIRSWGMKCFHLTLFLDLDPVATYDKWIKDNITMDGVWTTPGVKGKWGMLEFGALEECESDHCLLGVDMDNQSIMGHLPPLLAPINQKGLLMKDPKTIKK